MAKWPYTTQRWQRLRRMKLRQNPLCEVCLTVQRIESAVSVDHIVAIKAGGDVYPALDALTSLCESCHNRKSRIVEQQGKEMTIKGCDEQGYPLDPNHPFYKDRP
jgi:5-methylcytosine-specific restriction endonuclease McrA